MAVLDKLLEILDKVKDDNPELAEKLSSVAENLENEPEEEIQEEFDDSYLVLNAEDSDKILSLDLDLDKSIYSLGAHVRDMELIKKSLLSRVEDLKAEIESQSKILKEKYRCDPGAQYKVERTKENNKILAFVKKKD